MACIRHLKIHCLNASYFLRIKTFAVRTVSSLRFEPYYDPSPNGELTIFNVVDAAPRASQGSTNNTTR